MAQIRHVPDDVHRELKARAARAVIVADASAVVEVTQVLRRYALAGSLTGSGATTLVDELGQLPLIRHGHRPLLARAFELHPDVTAHDAVHLALAELLEAPLLTADATLVDVPGCSAIVELVRTSG